MGTTSRCASTLFTINVFFQSKSRITPFRRREQSPVSYTHLYCIDHQFEQGADDTETGKFYVQYIARTVYLLERYLCAMLVGRGRPSERYWLIRSNEYNIFSSDGSVLICLASWLILAPILRSSYCLLYTSRCV